MPTNTPSTFLSLVLPTIIQPYLTPFLALLTSLYYSSLTWLSSQWTKLLPPENKSSLVGTLLFLLAAIEVVQLGMEWIVRTINYFLDFFQLILFVGAVSVGGCLVLESLRKNEMKGSVKAGSGILNWSEGVIGKDGWVRVER